MSYLDIFAAYSDIAPLSLITLFFLTLMRIAPIVHLAPFLGAKVAPMMGRMSVAIALSVIFLPTLMMQVNTPLEFNTNFIGLSIKEFFIGLIFGFLITIPFYIVQASGSYIDFMRGASSLQVQDPTLQNQASPIGILYNYILIFLFFQINGPFFFFDAILKSYHMVPVDHYLNSYFFSASTPLWKTGVGLMAHIFALAIQIAAPALVAILMAETFLGIANRLAPQVQIAFLGMPIKSLLGIALLWVGWFFILKQAGKMTFNWIETIDKIISSLQYLQTR